MTTTLDALGEAVTALAELWPDETFGTGGLEGIPGGRLTALIHTAGTLHRLTDAVITQIAAETERQSRPELGPDSLAKQHGYRSAAMLLAATMGTSKAEATRFVQVGAATAPRMLLTGETAPALHPHIGEALSEGRIGKEAAAAIISMLDDVSPRVHPEVIDKAERSLVDNATGHTLDHLRRTIVHIEAYIDPDGVEPKEYELRSRAGVNIREDHTGMIVLTAKLDPARGAILLNTLDAFVRTELAAARDHAPDDKPGMLPRPIPQMQVDALVTVFEHFTGCEHTDTPLPGATVIVRVNLDDLQNDTGYGTIDGIDQPISISTVRRMAADGGIIPCILGRDSDILDWGRRQRLFTTAQRLALVERDGGCIGCGAPPGRSKAHHIRWWKNGGTTDLDNGCLLCDNCHHRIHDNGWDIRIDGTGTDANVWLIPPTWIDATQTPRPAARIRHTDFLA